MLGDNLVQTEPDQNITNSPLPQMPTPPGGGIGPDDEAKPRGKKDNIFGQILKRLAIAGVLGAVGGAPAVQVGGSVADLVGQIREKRKRDQALQSQAQAKADRQAKRDALEAEKVQATKDRNKIIADANKRAADFRETKGYGDMVGGAVKGGAKILQDFIGKPLNPLQEARKENVEVNTDIAKMKRDGTYVPPARAGRSSSGGGGSSSGGSGSKGVKAGSIRLPTGAVLSKQAFFSFLDNSPTDANSILNLTAEDPVTSAQLVEWSTEHKARKGKRKMGKLQMSEGEKKAQQNQDISNREYAGLVKEQQKGAAHLKGKSDAELRKMAQEHADRVKPAKSQTSMNFLSGLNAIAEKLK